MIKLYIINN